MMRRRIALTSLPLTAGAFTLLGCRQNNDSSAAGTPQKQDAKVLAGSLQTRTVALIDAINSRDNSRINTAKTALEQEANRVEDALKSETGGTANRINSAINRIRQSLITNDVTGLTAARDLLQQAQQG
jgi:hypothetical protein